MLKYVMTRLALLCVGLVIASLLIFFTLRMLPGDVAQVIAGTNSSPEQVAAIREAMGLNAPLWQQYWDWITAMLRGDMGNSLVTGTPVSEELLEKAQVTIPLGLLSLLIALIIASLGGVYAALNSYRARGNALNITAQAIAAVPVVWAGMMLVVLFAVVLNVLPAQGFSRSGWDDPAKAIQALILPALTIGIVEGAMLMRFIRSATLNVAEQDFIKTAAAKGRTVPSAVIRHGTGSIALSVISVLGLQFAGIIVGAVVIEELFSLPGIGRMLVSDVGARDLIKVQGELMVITGFVLVVGFIVDICHRLLDPRAREQK